MGWDRLFLRSGLRGWPSLATEEVDPKIVERFHQTRAIRRLAEAFEKDHQRKALLVMATGAGKTRTVIALADLLMRANWVKRVLFLADRALVGQAIKAFKRHLPSSANPSIIFIASQHVPDQDCELAGSGDSATGSRCSRST